MYYNYYNKKYKEDKEDRVKNKERFKVAVSTEWEAEVSYKTLIELLSFNSFKNPKWKDLTSKQQENLLDFLEKKYIFNSDRLLESRKLKLEKSTDRNGRSCPEGTKAFNSDEEVDDALIKLLEADNGEEGGMREKTENGFNPLSIYFKRFITDLLRISNQGDVRLTFKLMWNLIPVLAANHKLEVKDLNRTSKTPYHVYNKFNRKVITSDSNAESHIPLFATFGISEGFPDDFLDSYHKKTLFIPVSETGVFLIHHTLDNNPSLSPYEEYRDYYPSSKIIRIMK